jgi:hypothetical protein
MMNKRLMILVVIVIIGCFAAGFVINGFGGNHQANAESMKEHISKSMEETKKWKENLQKFHEEATKLMQKKGYEVQISASGQFYSSKPPEVMASGDKEVLAKHGKEIKQILQNLVNKYDLGKMVIKVEVQEHHKISKKDRELAEQSREILNIIDSILVQRNKGPYTTQIYARPPRIIKIEILQPSANFNRVKKDLDKQIHETIYEKKHLDFTVKVTKQTDSEIRDMKWHPIFDAVMEETDKEFGEYQGFGYSFHPLPLQIVIKTSLSKGSKERAEKIEQYVKQVIEIKREELSIEKVPYKVIIKGKNNKQVK